MSEKFVEGRLTNKREKANVNPSKKTERILLELDGCQLRTGLKVPGNKVGLTIRFQDCVYYRKFQSLGLPIGSGEIESAHKSIPQKRLKIAGATWHPLTINPMLALRIIRANNWWFEFWNKYQTPEFLNTVNTELERKIDLAV